jgi:hypothetical protein
MNGDAQTAPEIALMKVRLSDRLGITLGIAEVESFARDFCARATALVLSFHL